MRSHFVLSLGALLASCLTCTLALVGSASAASDDLAAIQATVLQHEKAALHAFRTHDKTSYLRLCLPSFYEITSDGTVNTLQDQLSELDDYLLGEYRMEDVVVTVVTSAVALIRYKISAEYTYKGRKLPVVPVLASAVWVFRDGEWKAATYQEVKLPAQR
jgi:Domain of unknown function (DUF4440)